MSKLKVSNKSFLGNNVEAYMVAVVIVMRVGSS